MGSCAWSSRGMNLSQQWQGVAGIQSSKMTKNRQQSISWQVNGASMSDQAGEGNNHIMVRCAFLRGAMKAMNSSI